MNDILFWEYFEKWVNINKKNNVRPVTFEKYQLSLKSLKRIVPDLKAKELDRLKYQNILNEYAKDHEKTTANDFHHHLKACIADLLDEKIIEQDPTRKAIVKYKESVKKKDKFLSQFETQCLIRTLELNGEINIDYLIFLLIKTGLRYSEAIAVTPSDFNFDSQTLSVNKTWDYKHGGGFAPTKNPSSIRKIQLDWQTARKMMTVLEKIPSDKPLFIYGTNKENLYSSVVMDRLSKKCTEAGIPCVGIHALRHTHASLLLASGVSVPSVSKRLGHANMDTTQRVYLHIIRELENRDNGLIIAAMMNLDT